MSKLARILIGLAVAAFLWLVWPTPYTGYGTTQWGVPQRRNRLTGHLEYYNQGRWR